MKLGTLMWFDVTDRLLTKYFVFGRYLRKNRVSYDTIHKLFIDFKKTYDSVKREVLYIIRTLNSVSPKNHITIKRCLSETSSRVRVGRFLSDAFPIHCGLKQRNALSRLLFNFTLKHVIRRIQETE